MAGWSGYSEKGQGSEERGPGTFTYSPAGVPQAQAAGATGVVMRNTKVRDINSVNEIPAEPSGDQTLGLIAKFASDQLGKQVEKIRGEKFLEGMQRAATGEALTTIINDRPWYSRVFGDGPVGEGARAFEVQSRVSQWVAKQDAAMSTLKRQSPDSIPAYIASSIKEYQTDDKDTNTMLAMQVIQQTPDLIKRHAREHVAFMQEEASIKQYGMMQSAATVLQGTGKPAADQFYSKEEVEARKDVFMAALTPPVGSNLDSWKTQVTTLVGSLAETGQFHALSAMQERGIFGAMKPEDQVKVTRLLDSSKRHHAGLASSEYASRIADIQAKARLRQLNADEVDAEYAKINSEYSTKSGNSEPVISTSMRVSTSLSAIQAQARYEAMAAKEVAKAAEGTDKIAAIRKGLSVSTSAELINNGVKAADVDQAFYQEFSTLDSTDPVQFNQQLGMLVRDSRSNRANPLIATRLAQLVNSAQSDTMDDSYIKGYTYWKGLGKTLEGGINARGVYFDSKVSDQYAAFDRQLAGRDIKEFGQFAFQASRQVRQHPGHKWTPDEKAGVEKFIENNFNERKGTWFINDNNLTKASKDVVFDAIAPHYEQLARNNPNQQEVLAEATAQAKAQGLEHAGDYTWISDPERPRLISFFTNTDIGKERRVTEKELAEAMNLTVSQYVKAHVGTTLTGAPASSNVQLLRGDINGKPAFRLLVTDSEGMAHLDVFDYTDIEQALKGEQLARFPKVAPTTPVAVPADARIPIQAYGGPRTR